jgi:hypothetical protein
MLVLLGKVAPKGVWVLLQVPLFEFVQNDTAESSNLTAIRGHYLLCDATTLAAICAVQHRDTGAAERQGVDHVKRVFVDIGLPLLEFPVNKNISEHQMRHQLDPILATSDVKACPSCRGPMTIRKANKGKRFGSIS